MTLAFVLLTPGRVGVFSSWLAEKFYDHVTFWGLCVSYKVSQGPFKLVTQILQA